MIGRIRGEIVLKQPPLLLLEVQGIGYEIEAPLSVFYDLPPVGETVTLITHLLIRDDAHVLYGFLHERERALFRNLLKVSGVGARMALAILSGMDAQGFARCVEQEDLTALKRLPGIGHKTAQRLVVEMRDRLAQIASSTGAVAIDGRGTAAPPDALSEAISALIALGYKPAEAQRMARSVDHDGHSPEAIIRAALQIAGAR